MTLDTLGIVLKTTKYGDTSIIVKIFTEALGVKSYIVKGIRSTKQKKSPQILFPGSILDLIVYTYPNRSLNFIKDFHLETNFGKLNESIIRNCIRMYAVELLDHLLTDDQEHIDIFYFYQSFIHNIHNLPEDQLNNAPIYYTIELIKMAGYRIQNNYNAANIYFLLEEGLFSYHPGESENKLNKEEGSILSQFLSAERYEDIKDLKFPISTRRNILDALLEFLQYHAPNFGTIKCVSVLQVILQ